MDFSKITDKAKDLLGRRGGTDALKEDAAELKDIARSEGSVADKVKAAGEALKHPGAAGDGGEAAAPAEPTQPAEPTTPTSAEPGRPSGAA